MDTTSPQNHQTPLSEDRQSPPPFWWKELLMALALVVVVGYVMVRYGLIKFLDKTVTPSDSQIVTIDTSNWSTFKNEKFGISMKVPEGYHEIFLGQDKETTIILSDITEEGLRDYIKTKEYLQKNSLGTEGPTIPILSIYKKKGVKSIEDALSSIHKQRISEIEEDLKRGNQFFQKRELIINTNEVLMIEDNIGWMYPTYTAYLKLKDGVLEINFSPETESLLFDQFEAILRNLSFDLPKI